MAPHSIEDINTFWRKDLLELKEYVSWRRKRPGHDRTLDLRTDTERIDTLIKDATDCGINRVVLEAVLHSCPGDPEAALEETDVDELCLQIMEAIIEREEIESGTDVVGAPVRAGGAISDGVIGELVSAISDACASTFGGTQTLANLVRVSLHRHNVKRTLRERREPIKRKMAAIAIASDPTIGNRSLGRALGVAHSTIGTWRKEKSFLTLVGDAEPVTNVDVLLRNLRLSEVE